MQIHELNPFQGTLGSEAFLVVDNGDDTGKISVERLTQPINDRIDDIITSPAPTEQEIIDARRGWNEVVYGSLGTAIRSQVKQILAQFYKFNTYDLLAVYGTPISRTRNGVTFTWDDAGQVCEVSGEAVGGDAYASIYTQTGAWPGIFEHGVVYTIGYETTDPNVKLRIAVWEGVETTPDYYYFDEDGHFGIPPEAAKISIDLWVASGDTVSAVVKNVYMLRTYTAKEVTATIRDAMIGADRHMYSSLGDAIREQLNGKVDKEEGMGLSQNSFTDAEKAKLEDIETGAQVNAIEAIKLDGTELTPDGNKAVDIPVDDTLTEAGTPAEAKAVGDELKKKANSDGYYETFTSGQTEQIIATEAITDTEPYIYRKTGGANDVGDRVFDTLVGGSVVWNQLVNSGDTEVTVPSGHKYFANINGTKSIGASTGTAISINDSTEDNVIDLTAALTPTIADYIYTLETANAGDGVAWVRKYFPGVYYGYCEPHFEHVQVSAKNTVGFNALDIDTYLSSGFSLSGTKLTNTKADTRTFFQPTIQLYKNGSFVATVATNYYSATGRFLRVFNTGNYDADFMIIRHSGSSMDINIARLPYSELLTNTDYCLSVTVEKNNPMAVGGLVLDEICLNVSGDRDGEYEPYKKRTYPLDSSLTLRGIPKLDSANRLYFDGDVYRHDGSGEERYGIVDLGTLNYTYVTDLNAPRFWCQLPNLKKGVATTGDGSFLMCDKYTRVCETRTAYADFFTLLSTSNKVITTYTTGGNATGIVIVDTAYTDAASFKAAVSGIYLVYEMNEPEPFTAEPYQSPMVVDPLGTEEFVDYAVEQGDRDVAIPVGHNSEYPADLRGKLQHLPGLSSSGDGRYVVVQTGTQMSLTPDTSLGLIAALEARVAALEGGN